jgi:Flp pilus assembly protein CpaB
MSVPSIAWWTVAALAGAVLVERVASDLAELSDRARAGGPPRAVVVAHADLPVGAVVQRDDVTTAYVPSDLVPADALSSLDDAVGAVAAVPVLTDTVLTERNLAAADRLGSADLVGPDQRLVRIIVEGGVQPEPGDVIDLLAPPGAADGLGAQDGPPAPARVVLRGGVVVATDHGGPAGAGGGGGLSPGDETLGVSLLTSPAEAARLVGAASERPLVAVLAPPESARPTP